MKKTGRIFVYTVIMFLICLGKVKAVQAYIVNVSTDQVSFYSSPLLRLSSAPIGTKIDTSFKAYLVNNNSKIFTSWKEVTDPNGVTMYGVVAQSDAIDSTGTYTVGAVAEDNVMNLFDPDEEVAYLGLEFASLGMTEIDGKKNYLTPTTFTIKPKTISVIRADGIVDIYDWSKLGDGTDNRLYNNGAKMPTTGQLRIGIVNNYAVKNQPEFGYANPFMVKQANSNEWKPANVYKIKEDGTQVLAKDGIPVSAGETFAVTFEVTLQGNEVVYPNVTNTPKLSQSITAKSFTMLKGTQKKLNAFTSGDGTLSYRSSNTNVVKVSDSGIVQATGFGKATITIYASETARYRAAVKTITVEVKRPQGTALKNVTSRKKGKITITWKKIKGISGYQLLLSRKKKFGAGSYQKDISSAKTKKVSASGLDSGKVYYVKIRTYQKVNSKKYYSSWSKLKKIRVR